VEPERGARSAAARKERPSGESGEVLRLHKAAGDLGSHADAEKRNPREAVVTLDRLAPLTPETRLALTVWALSRHRFRITERVQADVCDAPEVGGGLAGAGPTWREVAWLLRFSTWDRLPIRPRIVAFGHLVGTHENLVRGGEAHRRRTQEHGDIHEQQEGDYHPQLRPDVLRPPTEHRRPILARFVKPS
jgi:hypothetical protein